LDRPTKHEFGGEWTSEKLRRVKKYLSAYTTIFSWNPRARALHTIYVDAFAGTGYRSDSRKVRTEELPFPELLEEDVQAFLKGSARIALEVEPPFDKYVSIEKNSGRVKELEELRNQFPEKTQAIEIVNKEANAYLRTWCRVTNWRLNRGVVFLDPYGMQVDWSLIESIAVTLAIDLWILFPLGMAVNRLLTKAEVPSRKWSQALDRLFGSGTWKESFYVKKTVETLFGDEEVEVKDADFNAISVYFVNRLKTIFVGVADNLLPLRNSRNLPLFL
jgi:three-Cys-motif partner protein